MPKRLDDFIKMEIKCNGVYQKKKKVYQKKSSAMVAVQFTSSSYIIYLFFYI